jgi:tetratricopeptide (TPR) repeat protein
MEIDLLAKSGEYIREGKFEKAQIILRRILSDDPNQPRAIEMTGDLSLKLGHTQEAVQRYDNASNKYMNANQFAEAILCLEKIRMLEKTNDDVVARLADLYRFYGLPNRSVKTILNLCGWALDNKEDRIFVSGLRKIVELQPRNLPLRLSFSKVLLSIERKQDAHDVLMKLKSLAEEAHDDAILEAVNSLLPQPDGGEELDPKSRIELGNLLYEIGSKDEAIVEFEKAVADLVATGDTEEAISVLNRIMEIDPNNKTVLKKLQDLQGGTAVTAPAEAPVEEAVEELQPVEESVSESPASVEEPMSTPVEESLSEAPSEELTAPSENVTEAETPSEEPSTSDQGLNVFQDLGQDIAGFIPATDRTEEASQEPSPGTAEEPGSEEDVEQLEGQIADIEFLLKETEKAATPSFEISKEFDDYRKAIIWQEEDPNKLLQLARMAYKNDLYNTALSYVEDIRDKKETWPHSLEIHGGSLIKLGRYNDAKKYLAAALIFDDIHENEKIELRYLLSSAYEGLGDFDNAMREIERIVSINPNYRDVREIYALLGGKKLPAEELSAKVVTEPPKAQPAVSRAVPDTQPIPQSYSEIERPVPPPVESIVQGFSQPQPTYEKPTPPVPVSQEPPISEDTYPTIVEEMPSEAIPPQPFSEAPDKKRSETPELEEPPGENIAFL